MLATCRDKQKFCFHTQNNQWTLIQMEFPFMQPQKPNRPLKGSQEWRAPQGSVAKGVRGEGVGLSLLCRFLKGPS